MVALRPSPPPSPSRELDEVSVLRAKRGDHEAFRLLVERYHPAVHALVWRMLAGRPRDVAADLEQETFLRVYRALPQFDVLGAARLSTWILTIATRLVFNHLRRVPMTVLEPEKIAGIERTDRSAERTRLSIVLAEAAALLPEDQRAVFILRDYHELEYAEIAEILQAELGTVKSRLARAREAMRSHLAKRLPEHVGGAS